MYNNRHNTNRHNFNMGCNCGWMPPIPPIPPMPPINPCDTCPQCDLYKEQYRKLMDEYIATLSGSIEARASAQDLEALAKKYSDKAKSLSVDASEAKRKSDEAKMKYEECIKKYDYHHHCSSNNGCGWTNGCYRGQNMMPCACNQINGDCSECKQYEAEYITYHEAYIAVESSAYQALIEADVILELANKRNTVAKELEVEATIKKQAADEAKVNYDMCIKDCNNDECSGNCDCGCWC